MRRHAKRTHHDKVRPARFTADCFARSVYFLDIFATLFVIPELKGEPQTDYPPDWSFPRFGFTRVGSSIPLDWVISDGSRATLK
jgi:hypothetical protein